MTAAELAPHARKSVRGERRLWLVLGALSLFLGAALVVIPLLATHLREALPLAAVGLVVAVLPGALMTRVGLKRLDAHPLIVALERHPEQIRAISFGYQGGLRGYVELANVQVGARVWSFPVRRPRS